jgi:nicotinamide-nucleotide amidase
MVTDDELFKLAAKVGHVLVDSTRRLVTAESCTGGWVAKALTDIPGSSAWFVGGVVSYDDRLKQALLGVADETLAIHGAVSDATVREMALGALERLGGDVALAVSGIAGPDGGQPGKPVGTVWFGWAWRHGQAVHHRTRLKIIEGGREDVRRRSVITALTGVLEI